MDKLNPQPEPPVPLDIFGWLVYFFEWLLWGIRELFGLDAPIAG